MKICTRSAVISMEHFL